MDLTKRKRLGLVLFVIGLVFLSLFAMARYHYSRTRTVYRKLQATVEAAAAPAPTAVGSRLNFDELWAVNEETAAWLSIPALDISLPVTQTDNNADYLHMDFEGNASPAGCLFLAAEGSLEKPYNVIYGHNMADGTMFGKLTQYRDKAFWEANPTFYLYTPKGDYYCTIFTCHEDTDGSDTYRTDWEHGSIVYNSFLTDRKDSSLYETGVIATAEDMILTLSTCGSPYTNGKDRFVVQALLTPMQ